MDQLIAFHGIFGSCVLRPPQKDYFFAVPWRGSFGRILTMQLEPPKLQDPYFGPYRIIRIDGSRIHVRCSPRVGGELLCAPKQLRHYHSPDNLSWDEWRLSDSEVGRIDLENAASPEEADELKEMTADEMAVDGYYVVASIARHE